MELKFIVYDEGDWVEVIKDGKRVFGNHSLSWKEMLKILNIPYEVIHPESEEAFYAALGVYSEDYDLIQ